MPRRHGEGSTQQGQETAEHQRSLWLFFRAAGHGQKVGDDGDGHTRIQSIYCKLTRSFPSACQLAEIPAHQINVETSLLRIYILRVVVFISSPGQ